MTLFRHSFICFGALGFLSGVLAQTPPATFTALPSAGGGGSEFIDSAHFRLFSSITDEAANSTLNQLEAAYTCMVDTLGWRSSGLSYNLASDTAGPWYKTNIYDVKTLDGGAAGVMSADAESGMAYLNVLTEYLDEASVTVHEYGHVLTYHAKSWVDQGKTGAWWETVAQFVADFYLTSPSCESARTQHGQAEGKTIIELPKVIGDSFQVIVDGSQGTGNYYQAWPFLTYLTNNPDDFAGLGTDVLHQMFTQYDTGSNETPLHVLQRVANATTVQKIVGRYWARMAYLDIDHTQAQELFLSTRPTLNYANLDTDSAGSYSVKAARQPKYMGANIIPLKDASAVDVTITSQSPFTATLAIRSSSNAVRYIDLVDGKAQATVATGEEASLVVANTPDTLYSYDGFALSAEASQGLDYTIQLTGATA